MHTTCSSVQTTHHFSHTVNCCSTSSHPLLCLFKGRLKKQPSLSWVVSFGRPEQAPPTTFQIQLCLCGREETDHHTQAFWMEKSATLEMEVAWHISCPIPPNTQLWPNQETYHPTVTLHWLHSFSRFCGGVDGTFSGMEEEDITIMHRSTKKHEVIQTIDVKYESTASLHGTLDWAMEVAACSRNRSIRWGKGCFWPYFRENTQNMLSIFHQIWLVIGILMSLKMKLWLSPQPLREGLVSLNWLLAGTAKIATELKDLPLDFGWGWWLHSCYITASQKFFLKAVLYTTTSMLLSILAVCLRYMDGAFWYLHSIRQAPSVLYYNKKNHRNHTFTIWDL